MRKAILSLIIIASTSTVFANEDFHISFQNLGGSSGKLCITEGKWNDPNKKTVCSAPYQDSVAISEIGLNSQQLIGGVASRGDLQINELPSEGFNAKEFFSSQKPQLCKSSIKYQEELLSKLAETMATNRENNCN